MSLLTLMRGQGLDVPHETLELVVASVGLHLREAQLRSPDADGRELESMRQASVEKAIADVEAILGRREISEEGRTFLLGIAKDVGVTLDPLRARSAEAYLEGFRRALSVHPDTIAANTLKVLTSAIEKEGIQVDPASMPALERVDKAAPRLQPRESFRSIFFPVSGGGGYAADLLIAAAGLGQSADYLMSSGGGPSHPAVALAAVVGLPLGAILLTRVVANVVGRGADAVTREELVKTFDALPMEARALAAHAAHRALEACNEPGRIQLEPEVIRALEVVREAGANIDAPSKKIAAATYSSLKQMKVEATKPGASLRALRAALATMPNELRSFAERALRGSVASSQMDEAFVAALFDADPSVRLPAELSFYRRGAFLWKKALSTAQVEEITNQVDQIERPALRRSVAESLWSELFAKDGQRKLGVHFQDTEARALALRRLGKHIEDGQVRSFSGQLEAYVHGQTTGLSILNPFVSSKISSGQVERLRDQLSALPESEADEVKSRAWLGLFNRLGEPRAGVFFEDSGGQVALMQLLSGPGHVVEQLRSLGGLFSPPPSREAEKLLLADLRGLSKTQRENVAKGLGESKVRTALARSDPTFRSRALSLLFNDPDKALSFELEEILRNGRTLDEKDLDVLTRSHPLAIENRSLVTDRLARGLFDARGRPRGGVSFDSKDTQKAFLTALNIKPALE